MRGALHNSILFAYCKHIPFTNKCEFVRPQLSDEYATALAADEVAFVGGTPLIPNRLPFSGEKDWELPRSDPIVLSGRKWGVRWEPLVWVRLGCVVFTHARNLGDGYICIMAH